MCLPPTPPSCSPTKLVIAPCASATSNSGSARGVRLCGDTWDWRNEGADDVMTVGEGNKGYNLGVRDDGLVAEIGRVLVISIVVVVVIPRKPIVIV